MAPSSDNDLNTPNPWAASPTPSPSVDQPVTSGATNDDHEHDDDHHEERDAWGRGSMTGSSDEGGHSTILVPQEASTQAGISHITGNSIAQLQMNFDEFDPFRPDNNDDDDKMAITGASNTQDDEPVWHTGQDDDTTAYSEAVPPPTPSKRQGGTSSQRTDDNDPRHASIDVGQSAPHYTNTSTNTSTSSTSTSSSKSKSTSSLTSVQNAPTSSSPSTSTMQEKASSSNTNSTSPTSNSTASNVLSNPLATIASAFRKRDFSNSGNNSSNPSRSGTPTPGAQQQGQASTSSSSASRSTQQKSAEQKPTGKAAPVILIRDNDDDHSTILGDDFDGGKRGSISSLRLPGIGTSSSASTSTASAKGHNASSSSSSSGALSNSASIVQNSSTDSAGIIGDDTSTLNVDDNEKGGEGAGLAFDFNFFLDQMRNKAAEPIAKYLRSFLREFNKKMWNVNDQIRVINDFLDFIAIKMRENEIWKNDTEKEFDNAVEGMEKLVMNRVFHLTFVPALEPAQQATTQTDDLERDHVLSQRIKLFQWVSEEHLDLPEHKDTASFVEFAKQELRKINMYKAPRDKLICILNCCKVIFGLMRHLNLEDGADTFIPFLILVVLRANPDHLISNVQYIQRFRNPDRLAGENGYYLSSLNAAISFIETMDGSSLSNITQEQFEQNVEEAIRTLPSDDEQQELPPAQKEKDTQTRAEQASSSNRAGTSGPSQSMPSSPTKPMNEKRSSYQAEASLQAVQQGPPRSQSPAEATRDFFIRSSDNLQKTVSKPLAALGKIFTEMGSESEMIAGYPGPGHQQSPHAQGQAGHQQQHRHQQQPLSPHLGHQQQHLPPTPRGQRPPSLRTRSTTSLASPLSPGGRSNRLPPLPAGAQGHYESGYLPNVPQSARPGSLQSRGSSYQPADFLDDSVPAEEVQATADRNYKATFNAKIETLTSIFPAIERETLEIVLLSNGEDVERTIEGLLDMQ